MKWEPQTQLSHFPLYEHVLRSHRIIKPSFQLLLQRWWHESASEQVKTRTALSTCAIVMSPDQAVSSQVICGFKLCVMSHITFVKSSCHRFLNSKNTNEFYPLCAENLSGNEAVRFFGAQILLVKYVWRIILHHFLMQWTSSTMNPMRLAWCSLLVSMFLHSRVANKTSGLRYTSWYFPFFYVASCFSLCH